MRREAQLAALRYDEERQKNRSLQRDGVITYAKVHLLYPALRHFYHLCATFNLRHATLTGDMPL